MTDKLKIVVIDDDDTRKYLIRDNMPPYMEVYFCDYSESAMTLIGPDANGNKTDLIVLNAEDQRGLASGIFVRIKEDPDLVSIPVLLLCEDAFSDLALSFLDMGDAAYFEGDFDPDYFFMKVCETIEEAQMAPDEVEEPSFSEKDIDRILGLSVKPLGESEETIKRSIVLQHEEQLSQLDQALERGKKKQQKIKEIMELAVKYKEEIIKEEQQRRSEEQQRQNILKEQQNAANGLHKINGENAWQMLSDPEEDKRRTIVVVDDDPKNRKLCELFLQSDYKVVLISSGMSAIDYFVKARADLLLISFGMPVLDGLKILDSIRWQPNGKKVPVIFMTDEEPEIIRKKCQKERVVGLLKKPVSKQALRRSADAVLSTLRS